MERESFELWLQKNKNYKRSTALSRASNCQGIESVYGDLDIHYTRDGLKTVLNDFENKKHTVKIDGDYSTGTSTLKQALNLYIAYKNHSRINDVDDANIKKKEKLNDFLKIKDNELINYKIKLNVQNTAGEEPIDIMVSDEEARHSWMAWKYKSNELSRDFVIGLAREYKMGQMFWRFLGVFKILERYENITDGVGYKLKELDDYNEYKNKLILEYKNNSQNLIRNAETIIDDFIAVNETIFDSRDPLENIKIGQARLESIVDAFKKIGGEGKLKDIFDIIKNDSRFKFHRFNSDSSAEGTIRLIIQEHSSDSQTYKKTNEDLFYSIDGIGMGMWGLRKREVKLKNIDFSKSIDISSLYFEESDLLEKQISIALSSGKSIILIGPPGTGKSKLAKLIAKAYEVDFKMVTAMSDWSSYDTIGGYKPNIDGSLYFEEGIFLNSLKDKLGNNKNQWLLIDEINRADIDKAFGPFLSALSGDDIKLGLQDMDKRNIDLILEKNLEVDDELEGNEYVIPVDWRIIGTMNTFDKTSLYEMSYAFMRRFAFIPVAIPRNIDVTVISKLFKLWNLKTSESEYGNIAELWELINKYRKIGPALIEDIARFIELGGDYTSSIIIYILPQLEGLFDDRIKSFVRELSKLPFINDRDRLSDSAEDFFNMQITGE